MSSKIDQLANDRDVRAWLEESKELNLLAKIVQNVETLNTGFIADVGAVANDGTNDYHDVTVKVRSVKYGEDGTQTALDENKRGWIRVVAADSSGNLQYKGFTLSKASGNGIVIDDRFASNGELYVEVDGDNGFVCRVACPTSANENATKIYLMWQPDCMPLMACLNSIVLVTDFLHGA